MEKIIDNKLKLYFKDASGSQRTISIDKPKAAYAEIDIKDAMDKIIESNVLMTSKGQIATREKAHMEKIEKSPYKVK